MMLVTVTVVKTVKGEDVGGGDCEGYNVDNDNSFNGDSEGAGGGEGADGGDGDDG